MSELSRRGLLIGACTAVLAGCTSEPIQWRQIHVDLGDPDPKPTPDPSERLRQGARAQAQLAARYGELMQADLDLATAGIGRRVGADAGAHLRALGPLPTWSEGVAIADPPTMAPGEGYVDVLARWQTEFDAALLDTATPQLRELLAQIDACRYAHSIALTKPPPPPEVMNDPLTPPPAFQWSTPTAERVVVPTAAPAFTAAQTGAVSDMLAAVYSLRSTYQRWVIAFDSARQPFVRFEIGRLRQVRADLGAWIVQHDGQWPYDEIRPQTTPRVGDADPAQQAATATHRALMNLADTALVAIRDHGGTLAWCAVPFLRNVAAQLERLNLPTSPFVTAG